MRRIARDPAGYLVPALAMWLREPYGLQSAVDMDRAAIFPATLPVLLESSTPRG